MILTRSRDNATARFFLLTCPQILFEKRPMSFTIIKACPLQHLKAPFSSYSKASQFSDANSVTPSFAQYLGIFGRTKNKKALVQPTSLRKTFTQKPCAYAGFLCCMCFRYDTESQLDFQSNMTVVRAENIRVNFGFFYFVL